MIARRPHDLPGSVDASRARTRLVFTADRRATRTGRPRDGQTVVGLLAHPERLHVLPEGNSRCGGAPPPRAFVDGCPQGLSPPERLRPLTRGRTSSSSPPWMRWAQLSRRLRWRCAGAPGLGQLRCAAKRQRVSRDDRRSMAAALDLRRPLQPHAGLPVNSTVLRGTTGLSSSHAVRPRPCGAYAGRNWIGRERPRGCARCPCVYESWCFLSIIDAVAAASGAEPVLKPPLSDDLHGWVPTGSRGRRPGDLVVQPDFPARRARGNGTLTRSGCARTSSSRTPWESFTPSTRSSAGRAWQRSRKEAATVMRSVRTTPMTSTRCTPTETRLASRASGCSTPDLQRSKRPFGHPVPDYEARQTPAGVGAIPLRPGRPPIALHRVIRQVLGSR